MNIHHLNRTDDLTRRQFMLNAARAYLGVHLFPMLGTSIASAAPAAVGAGGKAKYVIYLYTRLIPSRKRKR
jgi:hypothetical protein